MNEVQKILASRVKLAKTNAQRTLLDGLPEVVGVKLTKGQRRLLKNHGTPYTFAIGCISALGEITFDECERSIRKYADEWRAA